MPEYDFGPDGCWLAFGCLAIIGLICAIGGFIYGIYWLINHINFI